MNYILYFIKFVYRLRYWLVVLPLLVMLFTIYLTRNMRREYTVSCSVYTGIISGFNILSDNATVGNVATQNSMIDNLLNIIHSDQTLKNVSLRLYARSLVYGSPTENNIYIQSGNYNRIYNHAIPDVKRLIDKTSSDDSINEDNTYKNFKAYMKNVPDNYLFGLYNWNMPFFNRESLKKIRVERDGRSDMLGISYSLSDPGLALQTVKILCDEFIQQYQDLRFGETNKVVEYFEEELAKITIELRNAEDELTNYNVEKRVINYEKETEQIAYLNTQYELMYWDLTQSRKSAQKIIEDLEARMGANAEIFRKNSKFLNYLNEISSLSNRMIESTFSGKTENNDKLQSQMERTEAQFKEFIGNYGDTKYGQDGLANKDVVDEWIKQLITYEKTGAELKVLDDRKKDLDYKYLSFSPIGSTLKRKDRSVQICEQQYFSILTALNAARLRQKSLLMTSATLKVIDPPEYPVSAVASNRKKIVLCSYFASFIFLIGFFIILELADRTLHNRLRAERLTGLKVVGAYPRLSRYKYKDFFDIDCDMASKALGNALLDRINGEKPAIVNMFSMESHEGKSFACQALKDYWTYIGLNVVYLDYERDFKVESSAFMHGKSITDFVVLKSDVDILLVEYPSFAENNVPQPYFKEAVSNIIVTDARRVWKETDRFRIDRLKGKLGKDIQLEMLLSHTERDSLQDFAGLLPPYTLLRKLIYRIEQLGITSIDMTRFNKNNNV